MHRIKSHEFKNIFVLVCFLTICMGECPDKSWMELYDSSACQFWFEDALLYYGQECCVYAKLDNCLRLEDEDGKCEDEIKELMLNKTSGSECDQDWIKLRFSHHKSPLFMPSECLFFFYWKQLIIDGFMFVLLILLIWFACFKFWRRNKAGSSLSGWHETRTKHIL